MRTHGYFFFVATLLSLAAVSAGCREDNLVPDPNVRPEADARVIDSNGERVDESVDGGSGLQFAFTGAPVEITLDGSESADENGEIVEYVWLSGTLDTDAGTGRFVPAGEDADWPADERRPTVSLGEGVWTFTLWVEDDDGARSEPDAVTITVGDPAPVAPAPGMGGDAVQECVDNVVPTVADACKSCVCGTSEACRMAADPSVCGEPCWGLLDCIGRLCPDYSMTMDVTCLTTNCAEFLSAGAAGAMMISACVTGCIDDCRGM